MFRIRKQLIYAIAVLQFTVIFTLPALTKAPITPVYPDTVVYNQNVIIDNYTWLRDKNNPQVKKYLKQEIKYAKAQMKASKPLAKTIYKEFINRMHETEISHPYFEHGYYYYTKQEKGKPYSLICRKKGSLSAKEEIVLNKNELAQNQNYLSLGTYSISPNQNLLAYSVDFTGDEIYELYLKDLITGKTAKTLIKNVSEAIWMADNETLLYTSVNQRMQTDMCYRWSIKNKESTGIYFEKDPGWDISLYQSCDEKVIFLSSSSKDQSETYYMYSDDISNGFTCIIPRQAKHYYCCDFYEGMFYFMSNYQSTEYYIAICEVEKVSANDWRILYQSSNGNPISGFGVFDACLVIIQRKMGFDNFVFIDRQSGLEMNTIAPEQPMDLSLWINTDPRAMELYYTVENEVTPLTIYKYNFIKQTSEIVREFLPAGPYDKTQYSTDLKWVKVASGVEIPLRLTYRTDLDMSKSHPVDLNGYGAYGDCEDPYFSSTRLSLLDRGVICATAHIRGGGEFGQNWYDNGRLLNKKNSFGDFIACMDYLLEKGITTKDKLIIEGGSAGGLLMGAVTNLAYDKCGLVIADVPFVDVLQTMLDDTLPLTVQEYEEWGDPHDNTAFEYIRSYSPVDNVKPVAYPTMLISAAWNDTRVGYWEAAKWTAKLRANNTGTNPIILRINWNEGHTGQVDRYQSLKYYAETMAYQLHFLSRK